MEKIMENLKDSNAIPSITRCSALNSLSNEPTYDFLTRGGIVIALKYLFVLSAYFLGYTICFVRI